MMACWLGLAAAQDGYSVVIKGPFKDALYDVVEDYDRQISVVGFSEHFPPNRGESQIYTSAFEYLADAARTRGEQVRLLTLDASGATTRDVSFSLPEFNRAVSIVKSPDDGYVVGGYLQNGQMLLAGLTPGGGIRFKSIFGTRNVDRMQRLIPLRDGGFLAVGTSVTSRSTDEKLFEQGLGGDDIFLSRFDKQGQQLWNRKYGTGNDDRGIAAAEAYDGSLIVLGTSDDGAKRRVLLMRLDENGESLWRKEYTAGERCNAYDLIAEGDERFVTALTQEAPSGKEQIRLVTFDLQQNILADRSIPTPSSAALHALARRSDGSLVGVGAITDTRNGTTDGLALSLTPTGTLQWRKTFGGTNRDLFRGVTILHDGSIVAVGETVEAGSNIVDMWIVKLYDDGSLAAKSTAKAPVVSGTGKAVADQTEQAHALSPFETAKGNDYKSQNSEIETHPFASSQRDTSDSALYNALNDAFSEEIANKHVTITKDLRIVLNHPVLLFKVGVYKLTPLQETFLSRFSNTLLGALQPFKGHIEALRINGHTSSEWRGAGFDDRYLNNMELSSKRAYSVLSYIFREPENAPYKKWLTDILSNDGYSYAKIVKNPEEDREASRRVTFEVVLK